MKVLLTVTGASLLDGINRHVLTIAGALNQLPDVEVAVCSVSAQGELHQALESKGVRTFSMNSPHGHAIPILWRFFGVMHRFKPDVVHVHGMGLFGRVIASVFFRRRVYVSTVHGIGGVSKFEQIILNAFPLKFTTRFFVSKGVLERCGTGDGREIVVYNPVALCDCSDKGRLRRELHLASTAPIIGTACRIAAIKQPESFTRIMCRVLKAIPLAHAVVMGDGGADILKTCTEIVVAEDLCDRFHFLGYRADARQLLEDLSCFVMTSPREGLPTAVLESMAAGVPIAFWRGDGGLKDLEELNATSATFGVLADQGDEQGLAQKIQGLLSDECVRNRMGIAGRQIVKQYFEASAVAKKLRDEYRFALNLV